MLSSPDVLGHFRTQMEPLEAARIAGRHHGVCLSSFGFGFAMNSVCRPMSRFFAEFVHAMKCLSVQLYLPPHDALSLLFTFYWSHVQQALLLEMSTVGHGMFSYIPDASMIGTHLQALPNRTL